MISSSPKPYEKLASLRRVFFERMIFRFLCLAGVVLFSACASLQPTLPPKHNALKLEVPFVEQQVAYCGPAALTSALRYYAKPAALETLVGQVYVPGRKGSLTLEMTAAARRHGLLPYPVAPSLDVLLKELDAGYPVLVLQNLGFDWWPQWHYALLVGYEDGGGTLLLHSGEHPYYALQAGTFMRTWARSDHWGLVLTPIDQIPETAAALPYLSTLDKIRQTNAVEKDRVQAALAQAALHWPHSASAQFVYANLLLEQDEAQRAADYYQRGLALQPDNALAWNNFAYALTALACHQQARRALRQGLSIAPEDERLLASWRELENSHPGADAAECPLR